MTAPIAPAALRDAVERRLPETADFLSELIRFPSTSGREHEAMRFLRDRFARVVGLAVEERPMSDALKDDPDYSSPVPDLRYDGRFNLRIVRAGRGGGRTLLFNTHVDVVPPSEGQADAWSGRIENGVVHGRGACDAKGQVAALYLVARALETLRPALRGDVVFHLVNEEENGGNGTLAMIRAGERADGCVVLEPSDGKLYTSIRGAVWFRIVFRGRAGHSGQAGRTRSALLMARDAMAALERYHADLLARSRGLPLFDPYPNPMPITFGKLHAGNWPASAPSEAVLEGVLGLLPNVAYAQVCREMQAALEGAGDGTIARDATLTFLYRHDSSVLDPEHPLPRALLAAAAAGGAPLTVSGMTASCDAWFYRNQLGIPTVVYGPGSLGVAHSKDERIALADIARAAETLLRLIADYCG